MSRAELIAIIGAASDEELKDVMLKAAVRLWLQHGASPEEVVMLALEVAEDIE